MIDLQQLNISARATLALSFLSTRSPLRPTAAREHAGTNARAHTHSHTWSPGTQTMPEGRYNDTTHHPHSNKISNYIWPQHMNSNNEHMTPCVAPAPAPPHRTTSCIHQRERERRFHLRHQWVSKWLLFACVRVFSHCVMSK